MKVSRADLLWNYGATFMRVASALIVLPLILKMLPQEEVALWTVMIGLNSMIYLLDFGFFQTFSRSVTYIYSGAKSLQKEGMTPISNGGELHYPLLKGILKAMSRFYALLSLLLLLLLLTGGGWYIERLLTDFSGSHLNAKIAWYSYGALLSYQFFTYYYDAALVGRGMIKRSRQIIVFSQLLHIVLSSILLLKGVGLISMVIGQSLATVVNRALARATFYDKETKKELSKVKPESWTTLIKTLSHTAYKNGIASLSWIFTNRMLPIIGALYLPLSTIASYGVTKQISDITITLSATWFFSYYPKLTSEQIKRDLSEVKSIYIRARIITFAIFIAVTAVVLLFADRVLLLIGSSTLLIGWSLTALLFLASLLEALTQLSTSVLMSRNEVPHYRAQLITALLTLLLLIVALKIFNLGVVALIALPMVVQLFYQHWRWTARLFGELKVTVGDYLNGFKTLYKSIKIFN